MLSNPAIPQAPPFSALCFILVRGSFHLTQTHRITLSFIAWGGEREEWGLALTPLVQETELAWPHAAILSVEYCALTSGCGSRIPILLQVLY